MNFRLTEFENTFKKKLEAKSEAKRRIDLNEPEDFILKSNEENDVGFLI